MSTQTVAIHQVAGTDSADKIKGSREDDLLFSGGLSSGTEKIRGKKGSDQFILNEDDAFVPNLANHKDGFINIIDFTIDDVLLNDQADVFNIGGFLSEKSLKADTVGDFIHVVSGQGGDARTTVYINKEGEFTEVERAAFDRGLDKGDISGADIVVGFKGKSADNNFSRITGHSDNTTEQFQTLIDLGFLDLSGVVEEYAEFVPNQVVGTGAADRLKGSRENDVIYSGGVSSGIESVRGRKGADQLILGKGDAVVTDQATRKNGFLSVKDFTIDDVNKNGQADVFSIGDFLNGKALNANTIGDYLHVVSGRGGDARTVVYIDKDGRLTSAEHEALNASSRASDVGVDIIVEFRGRATTNNFAAITGELDNSAGQFQALLDLGFLDVSKVFSDINLIGTHNNDDLVGTERDENIFSNGLSSGIESIESNGGADRLVLDEDDSYVADQANDNNGHFRIRDFVIDDVQKNEQADVLDIGAFLNQSGLNANTIGQYLHVVSGVYGANTTGIFINKEGDFTEQNRVNLTNNPEKGGEGADLFLEFQGWNANNNLALITGEADNTVEQFQALIDLGFLDLTREAKNVDLFLPVTDADRIVIDATGDADSLNGTSENEIIYSGGVTESVGVIVGNGPYAPRQGRYYYGPGAESIAGNGGSDKLVLDAGDNFFDGTAGDNRGHIRIRDFTIADTDTNEHADVLDIGGFLNGVNLNASNVGDYFHIISGVYGASNRTGVFVDKEGGFTDDDRKALSENVVEGGHGADLYLEFQGWEDVVVGDLVNNNFADVTGYSDNTIEQFQALIELGFLDLSASSDGSDLDGGAGVEEAELIIVSGTEYNDTLLGSSSDDVIFSGGVLFGTESISGNGGSDTLIFNRDDAFVVDRANDADGHIRIRDFTIDFVAENEEADILNLSDVLSQPDIDVNNLGDYLHVISGLYGVTRTGLFIDKEGGFTDEDRAALNANPSAGGYGSDIFLEFQGHVANNNFSQITGYEDNSIDQFRALIDMGFLEIA